MVIDVEPGRNHNPWIVLASNWPEDFVSAWDGDDTVYAPTVVQRNDEYEAGVLPGDRNRTPVGKIKPFNRVTGPVIRAFGPDFEFNVVRRGSDRGSIRSDRGPGLAHIMAWYQDPISQDQVCFAKDGREYMRFKPSTGAISYCQRATESFAGEDGAFGQIVGHGGFVSLEQRRRATQESETSDEIVVRRREFLISKQL